MPNFTREDIDERDIADAQAALDFHPDNSPYWDSRAGQDVMHIAELCGLESATTTEERRELYRHEREQEEREADFERNWEGERFERGEPNMFGERL